MSRKLTGFSLVLSRRWRSPPAPCRAAAAAAAAATSRSATRSATRRWSARPTRAAIGQQAHMQCMTLRAQAMGRIARTRRPITSARRQLPGNVDCTAASPAHRSRLPETTGTGGTTGDGGTPARPAPAAVAIAAICTRPTPAAPALAQGQAATCAHAEQLQQLRQFNAAGTPRLRLLTPRRPTARRPRSLPAGTQVAALPVRS